MTDTNQLLELLNQYQFNGSIAAWVGRDDGLIVELNDLASRGLLNRSERKCNAGTYIVYSVVTE